MKFIIAMAGFALVLSPVTATAKPHTAAHHTMHSAKMHHATHAAKMKTTCKGEFMYSKGGKCMDARNKAST
jgi:hypothetical protein